MFISIREGTNGYIKKYLCNIFDLLSSFLCKSSPHFSNGLKSLNLQPK